MQDTYHNLTLKTVMGLKWASIFCPQAKFVLKTDDDIYVNLPLLLDALSSENFAAITGGWVSMEKRGGVFFLHFHARFKFVRCSDTYSGTRKS